MTPKLPADVEAALAWRDVEMFLPALMLLRREATARVAAEAEVERLREMVASADAAWDAARASLVEQATTLRASLAAAVAEEREACAVACDAIHKKQSVNAAYHCAVEIRTRSGGSA